jgi:hypothetical protein
MSKSSDELAVAFSKLIGAFILGAALSVLFAWTTAWIVNHLFTTQVLALVFGGPRILFWQAFWLNILIGFGSRR